MSSNMYNNTLKAQMFHENYDINGESQRHILFVNRCKVKQVIHKNIHIKRPNPIPQALKKSQQKQSIKATHYSINQKPTTPKLKVFFLKPKNSKAKN